MMEIRAFVNNFKCAVCLYDQSAVVISISPSLYKGENKAKIVFLLDSLRQEYYAPVYRAYNREDKIFLYADISECSFVKAHPFLFLSNHFLGFDLSVKPSVPKKETQLKKCSAIPTNYNGHRFRSRAEARWSCVFDSLGIKYIYEMEGYTLSNGMHYLPDFYLPESDSYFEVKGSFNLMSDEEKIKIQQFIKDMNKSMTIGYADFTFQSCVCDWGDGYYLDAEEGSVLCFCHNCNKYYFQSDAGYWGCPCCGAYDGNAYRSVFRVGDKKSYDYDETVENAFELAQKKSFEKWDQ